MGIVEITMFTVKCDNCGSLWEDEDMIAWNKDFYAVDCALESGWKEQGKNIYCDECWSYDDNDNIIINVDRKHPEKSLRATDY